MKITFYAKSVSVCQGVNAIIVEADCANCAEILNHLSIDQINHYLAMRENGYKDNI